MSLKARLFKGGALLTASQLVGRAASLAINVQIAWVLTKEEFGIGAILWLVASFIRMSTELGIDQMLVQADDGDDPRLGGVAQTMLLARGLLTGAILLAVAYPTAVFFGCPDIAWAFALVALGPVIDGLRHRDVVRVQRQLRFAPAVVSGTLPDVIAALAAYPIAWWIGDFRVFLVLAFWRSGMATLATFLFAERPYRLAWSWDEGKRFLHFGWPLLANAMLMYVTIYGDRLLVASFCPKDALANYAVAVSLAMQPVMLVVGVLSSLALPILSAVKNDAPRFEKLFRDYAAGTTIAAVVFAAGFVWLGPAVLRLLYGAKYADAALLVQVLGLTHVLRLTRTPASGCAMAKGDTRLPLAANVLRTAMVFVAIPVALLVDPLVGIALTCLGSEAIASGGAALLLARKHRVPFRPQGWGLACLALVSAVSGAGYALTGDASTAVHAAGFIVTAAVAVLLLVAASSDARDVWHAAVAAPIARVVSGRPKASPLPSFGRAGEKPRDV